MRRCTELLVVLVSALVATGVALAEGRLDPKDVYSTHEWLANRHSESLNLFWKDQRKYKQHMRQTLDDVRKALLGKSISFDLHFSGVTANRVELQYRNKGEGALSRAGFEIKTAPQVKERYRILACDLVIGRQITREEFARWRKGQKIRVKAVVKNVLIMPSGGATGDLGQPVTLVVEDLRWELSE